MRMARTIRLEDVEIADSFLSRMHGLMFRTEFIKPIVFIFDYSARHSIHSLFVNFRFDAVYLDGRKKVVDVFEGIRPFTMLVTPKNKARFLVEFPSGEVERKKIKTGDSIVWRGG